MSGCPAQPLRCVLQTEQSERIDQEMIYRAALVVVHPLPQNEYERRGNDRRNEQHHAIESRQLRVRHPVDEDGEQQRQDDRSRQEHERELGRAPQARPHQRIMERIDVIVEADPVRRLVGEELVVGEADPEDAEDRVDLIAHKEGDRRQEEQPGAYAPSQRGRLAAQPLPRCADYARLAGRYRLRHASGRRSSVKRVIGSASLQYTALPRLASTTQRAARHPELEPGFRRRLRRSSCARGRDARRRSPDQVRGRADEAESAAPFFAA